MNRYFATVANKILFSNFIRFIFCILTVSLSLSSYIYIYFNTIFNNCIVRAFWFLKVFLNENFLGRLAEFVSLSFLFLFRRKWTITSERIDRKIAKSFAFPCSTSIVYTIRELESISSRYIFISFSLVRYTTRHPPYDTLLLQVISVTSFQFIVYPDS